MMNKPDFLYVDIEINENQKVVEKGGFCVNKKLGLGSNILQNLLCGYERKIISHYLPQKILNVTSCIKQYNWNLSH